MFSFGSDPINRYFGSEVLVNTSVKIFFFFSLYFVHFFFFSLLILESFLLFLRGI